MASILIADVQEATLARLRERALSHGRTLETEAKVILEESLQASPASIWEQVNAFRQRLAATNRVFVDSSEMLREDRER